jgi:hypothetical protein
MAVRIDATRPFSEVVAGGQAALSDPARYARWWQSDAVGTGGKYFDWKGDFIDSGYIARRVGGHSDDPPTRTRPDGS